MTVTRFIAMIGETGGEQARPCRNALIASGLAVTLVYPDLLLFADHPPLHLGQDGERGAIVGTLFRRKPAGGMLEALSPREQTVIAASGGTMLISVYWGAYVAILRDREHHLVDIIRDPGMMLPCYFASRGDLVLVASHLELLLATGLVERAIAWPSVAAHLAFGQLRPARTCIAGVQELLAGQRLRVSDGSTSVDTLWSPWDFTGQAAALADSAEAAEQLRSAILDSIGAWSTSFRHGVLGVSGGLDSSIVAAGLRAHDAGFSCITIATVDALGDERRQARILTDFLAVPLHEAFESLELVEIDSSDARDLPRPTARAFSQSSDRIQAAIAGDVDADCFLSGAGGDNVFCHIASVTPVVDRWLVEGFGAGVWRTANDVAKLSEHGVPAILARSFRRRRRRPPAYRWPRRISFLSAEARDAVRSAPDHPWNAMPRDALPGKAMHVAWILGIQNYLDGYARGRVHRLISPLLSQPVVETCLRIPSWLWCSAGRDRAVARDAFGDLLPQEIVNRTTKGSPSGFLQQLFDSYRDLVLARLADGMLAEAGLLDRDTLTAFFRRPEPPRGNELVTIMSLLDVEIWCRAQTGTARYGR